MKDDWANNYRSSTLPLTKEDLKEMFVGFDIVRLVERDKAGKTSLGKTKHWHTYSIVAIRY